MTSSEPSLDPMLSACGLLALPPHSTETGSLSLQGPHKRQHSRAPCSLYKLARAAMTKFHTPNSYKNRDVWSPSSGGPRCGQGGPCGGGDREMLRHWFSTALICSGMVPKLSGSENCLLPRSWERKSPRSHSHEIPCNLP